MDNVIRVFVGLDVHKDTIAVGAAQADRRDPAQHVASIAHDLPKLLKLLAKLGRPDEVHVVYEAGPTGFGLQRALSAKGYTCEVIAPSRTPKRPGDRVKTDRRDCLLLAEFSRNGQLSAVWVPDPGDEAIRDLARAREDAVNARTQMRQQLKAFLLRNDLRYPGKTSWNRDFQRWLDRLVFEADARQTAFLEYRQAVRSADERVARLEKALIASIAGWRFEPVVLALMALRGIAHVAAIGLVAEIGDLRRFDHPRKLMGYLGLVPSEHSSGQKVARGSITKVGNAHARRLAVEAAWSYRFRAQIGEAARRRQQNLDESLRDMAWKAQLRLCKRFASLKARGVHANKVCVATARELTGFIWAIGQHAMALHEANA